MGLIKKIWAKERKVVQQEPDFPPFVVLVIGFFGGVFPLPLPFDWVFLPCGGAAIDYYKFYPEFILDQS